MDVRLVSEDGARPRRVDELEELLARDDALVWVDIPQCDPEAVHVLSEGVRLPPDGDPGLR